MRSVKKSGVLLAAAFLAGSVPVMAHHASQVSYEMNRVIALSGVVTEFRFHNPHSQLFFEVKDSQGKTVSWAVELGSPGNWARAGWSRSVFKPGDKVSFEMHPAKTGARVGLPQSITMADGTVVDWQGQPIGPGSENRAGGD